LAQRALDGIGKVERRGQSFRDGVKNNQLAITAANLLFGTAPLADVEQKTLIGGYVPGGIAYSRGRFTDRADFAVLAADFKLEIVYRAVLVEESLEPVAIL